MTALLFFIISIFSCCEILTFQLFTHIISTLSQKSFMISETVFQRYMEDILVDNVSKSDLRHFGLRKRKRSVRSQNSCGSIYLQQSKSTEYLDSESREGFILVRWDHQET